MIFLYITIPLLLLLYLLNRLVKVGADGEKLSNLGVIYDSVIKAKRARDNKRKLKLMRRKYERR